MTCCEQNEIDIVFRRGVFLLKLSGVEQVPKLKMLLKNWESAFTLVRLVPTQKFTFSQITEVFFESRHDYIVIQSRLILTNLTPVPPGG